MNDSSISVEEVIPVTRIFPFANEHGAFLEDAGELFFAPVLAHGLMAHLQVIEQPDGWRSGIVANLPEGGYIRRPSGFDAPAPSRAEAIGNACESLIAWCSEQKERGGKRHRKQAEALQDWALDLEKREAALHSDAGSTPVREMQTSAKDGELRMIPIAELHESEWNPRKYYPEAGMAELVESMRTSGFREWLPLMVRPRPETAWRKIGEPLGYEIGAGHRRRRAAELAGIQMIPCIIRPMTDAEFLDVLNFDNNGREDVHPLHEASGWRHWMESTGKGVLDIAHRIGQSKEYVYQRLKYASLIQDAQESFLDGTITAGHAILIARLQPAEQKKALKYCTTHDWRGHAPGVRALAEHLQEAAYTDLRDCPFDRTARNLLSGAGSCEDCPKRAANIPGFEADAKENLGADICTDRTCYRQKVDNHLFRIRADLEAEAGTVLAISTNYVTKKKGAHTADKWERAKPGDKSAQTALVVEGDEIGQVVKVRLKSSGPSATESKEAREKEEQARKAKVDRELSVRRKILDAVRPKIGGLTRADVEALLREMLRSSEDAEVLCEWRQIKHDGHYADRALLAALPKMKDAEIFQLLVEASVASEFHDWAVDRKPEALLALAKRYKVDAAKIRLEMEEAAKEAEGGTRKEVIKKLPAKKKPVAKKTPAKKVVKKKAGKK